MGINPIPISKTGKYIVKTNFQCWYWLRGKPEPVKTVISAFRWNLWYAVAFPDVQAQGGWLGSHIFSHISANGEVPCPTVNVNTQYCYIKLWLSLENFCFINFWQLRMDVILLLCVKWKQGLLLSDHYTEALSNKGYLIKGHRNTLAMNFET